MEPIIEDDDHCYDNSVAVRKDSQSVIENKLKLSHRGVEGVEEEEENFYKGKKTKVKLEDVDNNSSNEFRKNLQSSTNGKKVTFSTTDVEDKKGEEHSSFYNNDNNDEMTSKIENSILGNEEKKYEDLNSDSFESDVSNAEKSIEWKIKFFSQKRQQTIIIHDEVRLSGKDKKANNNNDASPIMKMFLIGKVTGKMMKKKAEKTKNEDENNNDDGDDDYGKLNNSKRSSRKKRRKLKKERTSRKLRMSDSTKNSTLNRDEGCYKEAYVDDDQKSSDDENADEIVLLGNTGRSIGSVINFFNIQKQKSVRMEGDYSKAFKKNGESSDNDSDQIKEEEVDDNNSRPSNSERSSWKHSSSFMRKKKNYDDDDINRPSNSKRSSWKHLSRLRNSKQKKQTEIGKPMHNSIQTEEGLNRDTPVNNNSLKEPVSTLNLQYNNQTENRPQRIGTTVNADEDADDDEESSDDDSDGVLLLGNTNRSMGSILNFFSERSKSSVTWNGDESKISKGGGVSSDASIKDLSLMSRFLGKMMKKKKDRKTKSKDDNNNNNDDGINNKKPSVKKLTRRQKRKKKQTKIGKSTMIDDNTNNLHYNNQTGERFKKDATNNNDYYHDDTLKEPTHNLNYNNQTTPRFKDTKAPYGPSYCETGRKTHSSSKLHYNNQTTPQFKDTKTSNGSTYYETDEKPHHSSNLHYNNQTAPRFKDTAATTKTETKISHKTKTSTTGKVKKKYMKPRPKPKTTKFRKNDPLIRLYDRGMTATRAEHREQFHSEQ